MFDMRMHSDRDNPAERFDAPGNFTDQATKDQVRRLLRNFLEWTRRLAQFQSR